MHACRMQNKPACAADELDDCGSCRQALGVQIGELRPVLCSVSSSEKSAFVMCTADGMSENSVETYSNRTLQRHNCGCEFVAGFEEA